LTSLSFNIFNTLVADIKTPPINSTSNSHADVDDNGSLDKSCDSSKK
jgi:hypothetical protein